MLNMILDVLFAFESETGFHGSWNGGYVRMSYIFSVIVHFGGTTVNFQK